MTEKRKDPKDFKKRTFVALLLVGAFFLIFLGRAIYLVIQNGEEYSYKTLSQATGSKTALPATPGNIVDVNGIYLATSKIVYRLILDPKVLYATDQSYPGSFSATVSLLAEAFDLSEEELKESYAANASKSYVRFSSTLFSEEQYAKYEESVNRFQEEKQAFNRSVADKSAEKTARIAGAWFEKEFRREYPLDTTLSKIIGYTNDAGEGMLGLEKQYDRYLRGVDGLETQYVDENGDVLKTVTEATDGYTLVTSLDANIARIVKEEIAAFREEIGANRINVLVLNPKNGEILTMESDTEFSLNDPLNLTGLFTEEEWNHPEETFLLQEAFHTNPAALEAMTLKEKQLALLQQVQMNYGVSATFEPGSTGKAITLAAGIETGEIHESDTFYCDGEIEVEDYTIHCHMDTLCGDLHPSEALARSCNVCFVRLGWQVGNRTFAAFQRIFNFGQKTGVDLPGEANTANLLYTEENLHEIELATCSFGQGYNVTMLQMAAAYASFFTDGIYYEPHVVTEIRDSVGNTVKKIDPVKVRQTVSKSTADYIAEALRYTVTDGTPSGIIQFPGYTLAGKTGAAEKLPRGTGKYIVSFICASAKENPDFLLYVVVDEPHVEDQSVSAPALTLSAAILKRLYAYYNIFPENGDSSLID